MRTLRSSIDLGTNTCLLLVADWDSASQSVKRVEGDFSTIVRLGQGVDKSHALGPEAMERTLAALRSYSDQVKKAGLKPSQTVCVATSQARDAKNGSQFFERVETETGFKFRILSGEEEARYTFLGGLLPGMDPAEHVVIDIGGGSTEFMSQNQKGKSVDMGSVRFTERYLKSDPVTSEEYDACLSAIDQALQDVPLRRGDLQLVAVAGTATGLAAWHLGLEYFDRDKVDEVELRTADVARMVTELRGKSNAQRRKLPCMEPGRADVMLAGAMILWRSMGVLGFPTVRVSSRGLRYGTLSLTN